MGEDFRSYSVTVDGPSNFLSQLQMIESNLQSFLSQIALNWRGDSFNHLSSEQQKCVNNIKNLNKQVLGLKDVVELINYHIRDLNEKERLEEENRRLYPHLYWYDSDGHRHTDHAVLSQIRANDREIARLKQELNRYVNQIKGITGGR